MKVDFRYINYSRFLFLCAVNGKIQDHIENSLHIPDNASLIRCCESGVLAKMKYDKWILLLTLDIFKVKFHGIWGVVKNLTLERSIWTKKQRH